MKYKENETPPELKPEFMQALASYSGDKPEAAANIAKMRWYAKPGPQLDALKPIVCEECDILGVFDASDGVDWRHEVRRHGWILFKPGLAFCSKQCKKRYLKARYGH